MTAEWREVRDLAVLDFDIEARPLNWYGGDFVGKEPTAIAAAWVPRKGRPKVESRLLGECDSVEMLSWFKALYDEAQVVTGHHIAGYDLPVLQSAYLENELPLLGPKMVHDTKRDLVSMSGLSKSQENLASTLDVGAPKVTMNQAKWRRANRLTPQGIAETRERVVGDVIQHIQFRAELIRRGLLNPPRVWHPSAMSPRYVP